MSCQPALVEDQAAQNTQNFMYTQINNIGLKTNAPVRIHANTISLTNQNDDRNHKHEPEIAHFHLDSNKCPWNQNPNHMLCIILSTRKQ